MTRRHETAAPLDQRPDMKRPELVAQPPDVVLMDIRTHNLYGIKATRRITARDNPPRVLILTTFDLDEYVYEALRAGASGFLLKTPAPTSSSPPSASSAPAKRCSGPRSPVD